MIDYQAERDKQERNERRLTIAVVAMHAFIGCDSPPDVSDVSLPGALAKASFRVADCLLDELEREEKK